MISKYDEMSIKIFLTSPQSYIFYQMRSMIVRAAFMLIAMRRWSVAF